MSPTPPHSLVAALVAALALSACATATPYHAASMTDSAHADGYRELRVEPERWRVAFAGNSLTAREASLENRIIRPED